MYGREYLEWKRHKWLAQHAPMVLPEDSPYYGTISIDVPLTGCDICGGKRVWIRGRHPRDGRRKACPTCLQEKIDNIREISDNNYGRAKQCDSES